MRIYTMAQNLSFVPKEINETVYIQNIPYSLQQKLNIYGNICICKDTSLGIVLYNGSKGNGFVGSKVNKVIKVLNGYAKGNGN